MLTTVGPYQLYGSPLVAACAAAGTDYVDLCGEPAWMRQMIDAHDADAKASGARIVFSCGFDSIPFDLGVAFLQAEATKALRRALPARQGPRAQDEGRRSPAARRRALAPPWPRRRRTRTCSALLRDPFALTPGFSGPKQPSGITPEFDADLGVWAAPFVMAAINTRNVHRGNFLRGHRLWPRFRL